MNDSEWTTLKTFSFVTEAQLLRTLLEAHGIQVMIPEEHMASLTPAYTGMQVRVRVRRAEYARARELLEKEFGETFPEEPPASRPRTKFRLANLWRAIIGLIFGVPMREKK